MTLSSGKLLLTSSDGRLHAGLFRWDTIFNVVQRKVIPYSKWLLLLPTLVQGHCDASFPGGYLMLI